MSTGAAADLKEINLKQANSSASWLAIADGVPVGRSLLFHVPGLPRLVEAEYYLREDHFGRELLSDLTRPILGLTVKNNVRLISTRAPGYGTAELALLQRVGFYLEHEETVMLLNKDQTIQPADHPRTTVELPDISMAIEPFMQLYEECFIGLPWFQPYHSRDEVYSELGHRGNILFLRQGADRIGATLIRLRADGVGEIEPIGLRPSARGEGLGRLLLVSAVERLRQIGATEIQSALWRANTIAFHMFRHAGFEVSAHRMYLAMDVTDPVCNR